MQRARPQGHGPGPPGPCWPGSTARQASNRVARITSDVRVQRIRARLPWGGSDAAAGENAEPAAPRAGQHAATGAGNGVNALRAQLEAAGEVDREATVSSTSAAVVVPEQAPAGLQCGSGVRHDAGESPGTTAQLGRLPEDHRSVMTLVIEKRRIAGGGVRRPAYSGCVDGWVPGAPAHAKGGKVQDKLAGRPPVHHVAVVEGQRRVRGGKVAGSQCDTTARELVRREAQAGRRSAVRKFGEEASNAVLKRPDVNGKVRVVGREESTRRHDHASAAETRMQAANHPGSL